MKILDSSDHPAFDIVVISTTYILFLRKGRREIDLIFRVFGSVWTSGYLVPSCMVLGHTPAKFQSSSTSRKVRLKKNQSLRGYFRGFGP